MTIRFFLILIVIILAAFGVISVFFGKMRIQSIISIVLAVLIFSVQSIIPDDILSEKMKNLVGDEPNTYEKSLYLGDFYSLADEQKENDITVWASSDESVVSVDDQGNLVALQAGCVDITGSKSNGKVVAIWKLTVNVPVIDLETNNLFVFTGDSFQVQAVAEPTNIIIEWETKNPDIIIKNEDSKFTALKEGIGLIEASINYGERVYSQTCQVIVQTPSIELYDHDVQIAKGDSRTLKYDVNPTENSVVWSSNDSSVAIVSDDGVITATGNGITQVLSIVYYNGIEYQDACNVCVYTEPTEISELYLMSTTYGGFRKGDSVTDIYGTVWTGITYEASLSGYNGYQNGHSTQRYYTNCEYELLYGTIVLPSSQYNTGYTSYLKIYGDDTLLYTSPPISKAFAPLDFEVDISGVSELEIYLGGHWSLRAYECIPVIIGVYVE